MTIYGYMEDGYLRAKAIEPTVENYKDGDGNVKQKTISVEEQIERLSEEWKPVDDLDEAQLMSDDEDYIIIPKPYDAGDHIAYEYVRKFDVQKIRKEVSELKDTLYSSDYKVIKCYEASLIGEALPYDMTALHNERQEIRDRINELQGKL